QDSKLVGTGAAGAAGQGSSVTLSADGNTAIVGGPGDNGGVGAAWVFVQTPPPPPVCTFASQFGDFNGDGKDDILVRRADALLFQYLLNGFQVIAAQTAGAASVEWTLIAAADFNGDGKADMLFRRGDGQLQIVLLDGAQVLGAQLIGGVDPHFDFVGAGDFNGDGRADIL